MFVLSYHWLPLATIDLVFDNILQSYTHFRGIVVLSDNKETVVLKECGGGLHRWM